MEYEEIYKTIERLLRDESISNYKIQQDTGYSYGNLSELRHGKRQIKKLSLENAFILYSYQKQREQVQEERKEKNQAYKEIIKLLQINYRSIAESEDPEAMNQSNMKWLTSVRRLLEIMEEYDISVEQGQKDLEKCINQSAGEYMQQQLNKRYYNY